MSTIKPGQVQSLKTALRECLPDKMDTPRIRLFIVEQLIGREIEDLHELTEDEWRTLRREAYPHFREDDWMVGGDWCIRIADLFEEYLESIGQQRLF